MTALARVYLAYLRAHLQRILEYRTSFFIGIAAVLCRHVAGVLTLWVIFTQVRALGGWSPYQVVYLYGFVGLVSGLHHLLFMNTYRVEFMVQYGDMDRYLVRPLPVLFQVLLSYFDDDALGDLVPAILLMWVASVKLRIVYDLEAILVLLAGVAGGVLIYFGTHLVLSSWSFWFVKSRALIQLFAEVRRFSEYPLSIFGQAIQLFISLIVPIAFAGFFPAERILSAGTLSWAAYLSLPVGLVCLGIGLRVWHWGLAHYKSTGS
jgi:ABC-2 type transport system permease protein